LPGRELHPLEAPRLAWRTEVALNEGIIFADCFHFDTPGPGDLSIDLLGPPFTYAHGQLDVVGTRFKAVSRSGQPLSIMYYGKELTGLELDQLNGEAVNERGETFVFSGPHTQSCQPSAGTTSPWGATR
jgi:hypothetical protein